MEIRTPTIANIPKSKRNKRNYFNSATEDAIISYNNTDDYNQKSIIYEKYIHYSFFKLTQNIIHTFKFYNTDVDDLEHLQHELIIFLLSKIHLYNHKKSIQDRLNKIINKTFLEEYDGDFISYIGEQDKVTQKQINLFIEKIDVSQECMDELKKLTPPKAYSYFGTMVKRWLILYNKKNYNIKLNFDDIDSFGEDEHNYFCEEGEIDDKEQSELSIFIDKYIDYINVNLFKIFPKEDESRIADAILELFRKRESIDIFDKKALYIYIREIVDEKTPKITKVAKKMQRIFKHNYNFFLEHDYISFKC